MLSIDERKALQNSDTENVLAIFNAYDFGIAYLIVNGTAAKDIVLIDGFYCNTYKPTKVSDAHWQTSTEVFNKLSSPADAPLHGLSAAIVNENTALPNESCICFRAVMNAPMKISRIIEFGLIP